MDAFFVSIGVIALAEIGDKTQLLAFILASRFQQPLPIILGILTATLINHSLAGMVGLWITTLINPDALRWLLAASFIGMAIWTLIPDKIDQDESLLGHKLGVFGATFVTFFLAEMGDKTQIATIALTAHYNAPLLVIAGTTIGMLLADVPAVYIGNKFATKIPMKIVHAIAAVMFLSMGVLSIIYQA
ncbi:TMEM165/GDT1 family protein [uncultured Legionella sp.]|uniref:TMEM165/GDT1 family protein n=1 Tax=uncultured Legionella sp. TaxID=210934 RepID=UPI002620BB70|nr:TMEM165/GDT1 family protein [uncultured Legionella sp.]